MLEAFFLLTVLLTFLALARLGGFRFAAGMLVWLGVTAAVAATGMLQDFTHRPPPLFPLLVISAVLTVTLAFSQFGGNLVRTAPLAWIIGFQAFRILVEIFLDWGSHEGLVPPQMTFEGRNWDILTGVTALLVAWLAARGNLSRPILLAWNLLGLGLLLNIVTVAILSVPAPFQQFTPPNTFVTHPPYVWLPVFLVQAALFGHLLVFRFLSASSGRGSKYP